METIHSPLPLPDSSHLAITPQARPRGASILSLPPELLLLILQHGLSSIPSTPIRNSVSSWLNIPLRYPLFISTSLVCRALSDAAMTLLYEQIYVGSEQAAQRLLQSRAFGSLQTGRLAIKALSATSTAAILSKVVGLRHLDLHQYWGAHDGALQFEALCTSNLACLTSLNFASVDLSVDLSKFTETPFRLQSFCLTEYGSNTPQPFTCFDGTDLKTLHLGDIVEEDLTDAKLDDLGSFLRHYGRNLLTLQLGNLKSTLTQFSTYFYTLTSLQHLDLDNASSLMLSSLIEIPSQLLSITINSFSESLDKFLAALANLFESPLSKKLSKLTIGFVSRGIIETSDPRGVELLRTLEAKGVCLIFSANLTEL